MTVSAVDQHRGRVIAVVLFCAAASLWASAIFRTDRPFTITLTFALLCTAAGISVLLAYKHITEWLAFLSVPLLLGLLLVLASVTTDTFRVMDCSFLIGMGVLIGWFFFTGARHRIYTVVFVVGSWLVAGTAIATATDPASVAWATSSITVLAAVVCVAVGRLRRNVDVLSHTDWLTGALNRRGIERVADTLRAMNRGAGFRAALLAVDIDDFKQVNDTGGHAAGDRLLVEFVTAWKVATRASDVIGRIGGDEFVVILPGAATSDAYDLIGRMRRSTPIEFSAGITDLHPEDDIDQTIRRADNALYVDKKRRKKLS